MNNPKLKKFIQEHSIPNYEHLLNLEDAIEFVNLCKEEKVKLGGFDGFYLYPPNGVQPDTELSPDYSKYTKEEAVELALVFLSKQKENENVGYEFFYVEK